MKKTALFAALLGMTSIAGTAQADKLDDIISSGTLRCAVVLDFPPMGMRDANNVPIGFDVDYCNDLAAALGVEAEIVETPFPERIPALMSGRVDVGVASTSDTLERAKTVGFSIPYFAFEMAVTANSGTGITSYEGMKGHTVGAVAGTKDITVVGFAPFDTDYVALFAKRDEYGFLNYLDLFVNQQVRTGRYDELYEKWVGGEVPKLMVPNAHR